MTELEFFDDPRAFLDVAGEHLAAEPVLNTVVSTVTHRAADGGLPPATGALGYRPVVDMANLVIR